MTWTYHCPADGMLITADTRDMLIEKLMQHVKEAHNLHWSREQAEQEIEKHATRAA